LGKHHHLGGVGRSLGIGRWFGRGLADGGSCPAALLLPAGTPGPASPACRRTTLPHWACLLPGWNTYLPALSPPLGRPLGCMGLTYTRHLPPRFTGFGAACLPLWGAPLEWDCSYRAALSLSLQGFFSTTLQDIFSGQGQELATACHLRLSHLTGTLFLWDSGCFVWVFSPFHHYHASFLVGSLPANALPSSSLSACFLSLHFSAYCSLPTDFP